MNDSFLCIKCNQKLSHTYPLFCRCGLKYTSETEYEQLPKMTLEQSIELRQKLGLSAYGMSQPGLSRVLPRPEKPTDLPEEVVSWLNQYDNEEKQ